MHRMLTPSRVLVVAFAFSIVTFFWTFAHPRALPEPLLPAAGAHRAHHAQHTQHTQALDPRPAPNQAVSPTVATAVRPHATSLVTRIASSSIDSATSTAQPAGTPGTALQSARPPYPTLPALNGTATNTTTAPRRTCRDVAGAEDVMVIVKTSKAELHNHVPTLLETLLSCVPHHAIFSDHQGLVGNLTVHDALEALSPATKAKYDEFRDYEKQKQEGVKLHSVSDKLDRWKTLPMLYRAYTMRPSSRFFLVIEPDSSVSWTNLVQWISRLDSRMPYYVGSPLQLGATKFAQYGSGILLSNAALRSFAKAYEELYESEWEPRVARESLGDVILATAMADSLVELYSAHPLLQAQAPLSVAWSQKYWCVPAVSFHRQSPHHLRETWRFETNWTTGNGWNEPYLHRDAFADLVQPALVDRKEEWDNGSEGTVIAQPLLDDLEREESQEYHEHDQDLRQAVQSPENCQKVCEMAIDCNQWKWSRKGRGQCVLGKNIRFGASAPKKEGEDPWISGWIVDRIQNRTTEWHCDGPNWRFNQ